MRARSLASIGAVVATLSSPLVARAATYTVGPGESYPDLGSVAGLLAPGDVVLVDGNHTYPSVHFTKSGSAGSPITIRGVIVSGKRPIVSGGTNTIEAQGDHYVFENLEITGGSSRCFFHHADDITLRLSAVHDCPLQGILGADNDSGSMLMEFDEVYACGMGTQDHQIYMATDETTHPGSVFRLQHCYIHDGNGGNDVKSRAERNEIYANWIEGAFYHELELIGPDPSGGTPEDAKREDSDVVGNVLFQRNSFYVTRFGGDGTGQSNGRYRFVNNTVIVQAGGSAVFRLFDGLESLEAHNNVFFAVGGGALNVMREVEAVWVTGSETISGTNNWVVSGATNVPTEWTATIMGADPLLVSLTTPDLHPTASSPLVDKGGPATGAPAGHDFPSPLALPVFEPPMMTVGTAPVPRPVVATIDIGAYEYGTGPAADSGPTDATVGDTGGGGDASHADSTIGDGGGVDAKSDAPGGDSSSSSDGANDDGGATSGSSNDTGGCGCHTSPASQRSITWPIALAAMALAVRRRRGRAERSG